jgi:hypothetical protein
LHDEHEEADAEQKKQKLHAAHTVRGRRSLATGAGIFVFRRTYGIGALVATASFGRGGVAP